jgi:hypothetical protein
MTLRRNHTASLFLATAAALAGCGGGMQTAPGGALSASNPMQAVSLQPQDQGHQNCPNDGGITVRPCRIKFDANHSGPKDVMVSQDGNNDRDNHAIKERDDCASRNIATVAKAFRTVYTVTPGTVKGECTAVFSDRNHDRDHDQDGRGNGGSSLQIINGI